MVQIGPDWLEATRRDTPPTIPSLIGPPWQSYLPHRTNIQEKAK